MPNITSITHYSLKLIFAVHFVLVTWGLQGHWCPKSVMFYNSIFFVCLLWGIHSFETDEPIQLALLVNVLSIFFDIITLSIYFPRYDGSEQFSAAMVIVNLVVRVATSFSLLHIGQSRGGTLASMFPPSPAMGHGRQDYEEISPPIPQSSEFA